MSETYKSVDSVETFKEAFESVRKAQEEFSKFSQEKVDEIFKVAAMAANQARIHLAKMAVEETGMGVVEDKVIKNHYAAEYIYNAYKNTKTCGVIEEDKSAGIKKIAEPIGVIAAIIPTTNLLKSRFLRVLLFSSRPYPIPGVAVTGEASGYSLLPHFTQNFISSGLFLYKKSSKTTFSSFPILYVAPSSTVDSEMLFCSMCGTMVKKECPNCNHINNRRNDHCKKCGTKLD